VTTKQQLTKNINDISVKLKDGVFKDKQEMDNLTFEREKLIFGLSIVEEFESRSCESCKHFNPSEGSKIEGNGTNWIECDIIYAEGQDNVDDFYCNKYKKKENK